MYCIQCVLAAAVHTLNFIYLFIYLFTYLPIFLAQNKYRMISPDLNIFHKTCGLAQVKTKMFFIVCCAFLFNLVSGLPLSIEGLIA